MLLFLSKFPHAEGNSIDFRMNIFKKTPSSFLDMEATRNTTSFNLLLTFLNSRIEGKDYVIKLIHSTEINGNTEIDFTDSTLFYGGIIIINREQVNVKTEIISQ